MPDRLVPGVLHDVRIDVHGNRDLRVPEDFNHDAFLGIQVVDEDTDEYAAAEAGVRQAEVDAVAVPFLLAVPLAAVAFPVVLNVPLLHDPGLGSRVRALGR